ncbi:MAG: peptidyl-prolyl cis-trans isomerase, partial [Alphaproteobacteria bacterium]|nr:peptidyl-prolyl cis-trans isomerase [Alphaproteobacteria bacterium]
INLKSIIPSTKLDNTQLTNFDEHKKELDKPERRDVLQMVFLNKEDAAKAFDKLNSGEDFNEVAKELEAENADNPTLGVVSYDELAESLADEAFGLKKDEMKLVEIADSWQVIKISEIIPAQEATFEEAKQDIEAILTEENLYDALRDARADIDDAISSGKTLNDVAKEFSVDIMSVTGVKEAVVLENVSEALKGIAKSVDFNEMVFSYGLNEISSTEEFDDGIVVVEVTDIIDAHLPEIGEVKDEIISIWNVQEKNAVAKEIAENIVIDIQEGGDITTASKARGLEVFISEPISRNETFAGLSKYDVADLFLANSNEAKIYEMSGNRFIIAVEADTINFVDELNEEDLKEINKEAESSILSDMTKSMLDAYAKDLKIEIDYKKAGFSE